MTKMKSKKMTKSTFAIIIMAIAMVAMLAFGGTYAYFTDVANVGTFDTVTTGKIRLGANTKFSNTTVLQNIVPTEPIFEAPITLEIIDESNRAAYIFIEFDITASGVSAEQLTNLTVNGLSDGLDVAVKETGKADTTVDLVEGTVTVENPLKEEEGQPDTISKKIYYILTTDNEERNLATRTYTISDLNATLTKDADNSWQEKQITITASVNIIQAAGFSGPTALQDAYDAQKVKYQA